MCWPGCVGRGPAMIRAVLVDLAVATADGAETVSDIAVLVDQPGLFGKVASDSTCWRLGPGCGHARGDPAHRLDLPGGRCPGARRALCLPTGPRCPSAALLRDQHLWQAGQRSA